MPSKRLYLLGEDVTTAREVEVPLDLELVDLQEIAAAHFGIVEPKGMLTCPIIENQTPPSHSKQAFHFHHKM
jgi:hypothetical protein